MTQHCSKMTLQLSKPSSILSCSLQIVPKVLGVLLSVSTDLVGLVRPEMLAGSSQQLLIDHVRSLEGSVPGVLLIPNEI